MKAKLVCYSLGKLDATKRRNFQREMNGFKDFSNNGKYVYERDGLLQSTGSERMGLSILTKQSDAPKILKLLKRYGARIHTFDVLTRKKL